VTGAIDPGDLTSIRAVATLAEDVRRHLFGFIRAARRPVSREEAAAAVGISRKLAAFHLDKLVDAGLLRYGFNHAGAPRIGRRPKVYEPAGDDIQVNIPPRRHELLSDILVTALLTEAEHGSARTAAAAAAHQKGFAAATAMRDRIRPGRLGAERALGLAEDILHGHGFEPSRAGVSCVRLRNCPFHPIVQEAPELVCQLNLAFMRGLIEGLQVHTVDAVLDPVAGECCVELRRNAHNVTSVDENP
jgi:predicted ArsR family transcriptional regulator